MMNKILFVLLCLMLGFVQLDAQCDKPSILWDEDGSLLNWIQVDNAEKYEVQYRKEGAFNWKKVEVNKSHFELKKFDACAKYEFRVSTICNDGKKSTFSSVYITTVNCGSCYKDYCEIPLLNNFANYIKKIEFGGYSNISNKAATASYDDFRGSLDIVLQAEDEVYFEIEIATAQEEGLLTSAFIDWNRNFKFEGNEKIFSKKLVDSESVFEYIKVPADFKPGISRMRIISTKDSDNPCRDGNAIKIGEVEEYCVVLGSKTYACDFDFEANLNDVYPGGADFTWEELTAAEGYNVRYKKVKDDEKSWKELTATEEKISLSELTPCTEYQFQVRGVCSFDTSAYKNEIIFQSFCPGTSIEPTALIQDVQINPNPWVDAFSLVLHMEKPSTVQLNMYALDGRAISLGTHRLNTGKQTIYNDQLNNLKPGIYFVSIRDESGYMKTIKTIKLQ